MTQEVFGVNSFNVYDSINRKIVVAQKFLSHSHVQLSMEEEEERRKRNKHHHQRQEEQEEYDVSKIVIGILEVTKW